MESNPTEIRSSIRIVTGSRLHFGLTCTGSGENGCYAGIGVMIRKPVTEVVVESCGHLRIGGAQIDRTRHQVRTWLRNTLACEFLRSMLAGQNTLGSALGMIEDSPDDAVGNLPCQVRIVRAPPAHTGLGTGTQLALAVGLALDKFFQLPATEPEELAGRMSRSQRSAIGTYGFFNGGLLIDRHVSSSLKSPPNPLVKNGVIAAAPHLLSNHSDSTGPNRLARSIPMPADWRVVLIRFKKIAGLSGDVEKSAFARLPKTDRGMQQCLNRLIADEIVPAVTSQDFASFSQSIYRYGSLSGQLFSPIQGGPYNGRQITELISMLRGMGVVGVGQSSWGPSVFAWCSDADAAKGLRAKLASRLQSSAEVWETTAANEKAAVKVKSARESVSVG